jgi:hypothetical protein
VLEFRSSTTTYYAFPGDNFGNMQGPVPSAMLRHGDDRRGVVGRTAMWWAG